MRDTGFLKNISDYFKVNEFQIFDERLTTGTSSYFNVQKKATYVVFQFYGTWDGAVKFFKGFRSAETSSSFNASIFNSNGDEVREVTSNGLYFMDVREYERIRLIVTEMNSGAVNCVARTSNKQLPFLLSRNENTKHKVDKTTVYSSYQPSGTPDLSDPIDPIGKSLALIDVRGAFVADIEVVAVTTPSDSDGAPISIQNEIGESLDVISSSGFYYVDINAVDRIWLRITSYTSGSITAEVRTTTGSTELGARYLKRLNGKLEGISVTDQKSGHERLTAYADWWQNDDYSHFLEFNQTVKHLTVVNYSDSVPVEIVINEDDSSVYQLNDPAVMEERKKLRRKIMPGGSYRMENQYIDKMHYASVVGTAEIGVIWGDSPNHVTTNIVGQKVELESWGYYNIHDSKGNVQLLVDRYDNKKVLVSTDGGQTILNEHTFTSSTRVGFVSTTMTLLVFVGTNAGGSVWRSDDLGATWTEVLTNVIRWYRTGIYNNGNGIYFAEYPLGTETEVNIYRSTDDGATWVVDYTVPKGQGAGEIRHFHTILLIPDESIWIATAGDGNDQNRWYVRESGSWSFLPMTGNSQRWRTVGMYYDGQGNIIWGADATNRRDGQGIFKVKIGDLYDANKDWRDVEVLYTLNQICWHFTGFDGNLIAATGPHPEYPDAGPARIYLSRDLGKTWDKVLQWRQTFNGTTPNAGFRTGTQIDADGWTWIPVVNVLNGGSESNLTSGVKIRI